MTVERIGDVAVVRESGALRRVVEGWRAQGERVALTPTMGALHAGHASLVGHARARASRVVMSIFVNPTQFAEGEDFEAYPRALAADAAAFAAAGGDLVYAPAAAEIYPDGFATMVKVGGPALAGLEDRFRPTHFSGVATVVAKLFNQCRPDLAVFGEKDYQQLKVVSRMTRDLDLGVEIVPAPTLREADGLALSSRNVYLSAEERRRAPALHEALCACAAAIRAGGEVGESLEQARETLAIAGFDADYVEARDAATLEPEPAEGFGARALRLLAAARLGRTRLIDNLAV
ncbi:pantoate--beta-alanine ligase [Methylocella sp.]|uniref:pantoate--beta-alanine ligase n=1 Tax=Methylocella sp. TaxID=1978226 RepID=UPI003784A2AB